MTYYLKKRHVFGDLKLESTIHQNIRRRAGGKRRGINRVAWPMRSKMPRTAPGAGIVPSLFALMGPRAAAGTYTVQMIKGNDTFTSTIALVPDPGSRHTDADRAVQLDAARKLYTMVERLAYLVEAIINLRDRATAVAKALPDKDVLRQRVQALADGLEAQRKSLVASQRGEGISGEEKWGAGLLYGNVNEYENPPVAIGPVGGARPAASEAGAAFDATAAGVGGPEFAVGEEEDRSAVEAYAEAWAEVVCRSLPRAPMCLATWAPSRLPAPSARSTDPPPSHSTRNAASNASPAPVVSTTGTGTAESHQDSPAR